MLKSDMLVAAPLFMMTVGGIGQQTHQNISSSLLSSDSKLTKICLTQLIDAIVIISSYRKRGLRFQKSTTDLSPSQSNQIYKYTLYTLYVTGYLTQVG